jgi:integrase
MATIRHIRYKTKKRGEKRDKFEVSIMVPGPGGKRQERKIFDTHEEAATYLAEREREIREGIAARSAPITLGAAVEKVVSTLRARGNRTVNETERLWKRLVGHFGAGAKVTQITAETIRRYEADVLTKPHPRLQRPITISTVNRHKAAIRRLLRLCRAWGYIRETPHIEMGREPDHRTRYLERDEIVRLLDACRTSHNKYLHALVVLALQTGMRRGELFGLRWGHVDFSRGVLIVDRSKNGRRREVPMTTTAYTVLRELREKAKDADGPVFGSNGRAFGDVKHGFTTACVKAGINPKRPSKTDPGKRTPKADPPPPSRPQFRFHDLRHTAASWLVMNGAALQDVRELLGHRDLQMTLRYAHLSPAHLRSAIGRLDAMFSPATVDAALNGNSTANADSERTAVRK